MPRYVRLKPGATKSVQIATEAELLDFANRLREAGDADPLEALMPSKPCDKQECLIANACNFKSEVTPLGDVNQETRDCREWGLIFPSNMTHARCAAIAEKMGCEYRRRAETFSRVMILPATIGAAAAAFDAKVAFTKYIKEG